MGHAHRIEYFGDDGDDDDHWHVTEVAIFYVSELQGLVRDEGVPFQRALIEAGRNRLRPIAMTTIAAVLALLPLAFALGQGSAMQQPLAIAII